VRALVTGGAAGLGAAMVARLEAEGFEVDVLDLTTGFDVTDPSQWDAVGPVDVACLNAGILGGKADPAAISVRDVMTASEHQTFEMNCEHHPVDAERCGPGTACTIRPVWQALQQRVDDLLEGISLADLLKDQGEVQELVTLTPGRA
jgi:NAD(P)-dependent dehydrogenase (short-subunit alcohol dehydrogenase family)